MSEIHKDSSGTEFRVTIKDINDNAIDISNSSTKQMIFKKPSGNTVTVSADFYTDGTDGILSYVAASGLLDEVGTWKIQASIEALNGLWYSSFKSFKVHRNLS